MNYRFALTKRTFEDNAIISFIDLLGTCASSENSTIESQAEKFFYALISEFDIEFSEHFSEKEIKNNFDVSIFADSIAINQRIKTQKVVERFAKFLLQYQVSIFLNRKIQSRAIITTGPFFSFKISPTHSCSKSILASEFTNIGLCGGLGVIKADKDLNGLPMGVYVSEELIGNLNAEQQSLLVPVVDKKLQFLRQPNDNPAPFFSDNALKKLVACSEISENDVLSAINESYSGIALDKISPWILANMGKLNRIRVIDCKEQKNEKKIT